MSENLEKAKSLLVAKKKNQENKTYKIYLFF